MTEDVKPVLVIIPVGVIVGTADKLDDTVDVDAIVLSGPTGPTEPVSVELWMPLEETLFVEVS